MTAKIKSKHVPTCFSNTRPGSHLFLKYCNDKNCLVREQCGFYDELIIVETDEVKNNGF